MLTKPDIHVARSMHVIVRLPAWKSVDQFLRQELAQVHSNMLNTADTATLHALRGRAQTLTEFLKLTEETQQLLERLEKPNSRP